MRSVLIRNLTGSDITFLGYIIHPDMSKSFPYHAFRDDPRYSEEINRLGDSIEVTIETIGGGTTPEAGMRDSALPNLFFHAADRINVIAALGQQGSKTYITLTDNVQRTITLPVSFNMRTVGPGGWDVSSQLTDGFVYAYLVPTLGNPKVLETRISLLMPNSGPSGFSVFKYIGPVLVKDGDFIPFTQEDEKFNYAYSMSVLNLGPNDIHTEATPVEVNLDAFVPKTAGSVIITVNLKSAEGGSGFVELYQSGYQGIKSFRQIQVEESEWNQEIANFPIPGASKKIYRRLENLTGKLDQFRISIIGWSDCYIAER
jgi:hypothetical protein